MTIHRRKEKYHADVPHWPSNGRRRAYHDVPGDGPHLQCKRWRRLLRYRRRAGGGKRVLHRHRMGENGLKMLTAYRPPSAGANAPADGTFYCNKRLSG